MVNTFDNGYAAISDTRLLNFFKTDESTVTAWILKEKSNFRLLRHKDGNISVAVYDINIEPANTFGVKMVAMMKIVESFTFAKKLFYKFPTTGTLADLVTNSVRLAMTSLLKKMISQIWPMNKFWFCWETDIQKYAKNIKTNNVLMELIFVITFTSALIWLLVNVRNQKPSVGYFMRMV